MGRQYQVIAKHSEGATLEPMGTRSKIADDLGTMNIHPQTPEGSVLYGPGVTIEPMEMDGEVQQMMLTHVESEIAWFVTERILRTFPWKLRDLVRIIIWTRVLTSAKCSAFFQPETPSHERTNFFPLFWGEAG